MLLHAFLALTQIEQISVNQVQIDKAGVIRIQHRGQVIFEGRVSSTKQWKSSVRLVESPAQDVPLGYPHGPKTSEFVPDGRMKQSIVIALEGDCQIDGTVNASRDSFAAKPAEEDRVVRNAHGQADNGLNTGVYDRTSDWLIRTEKADTWSVRSKSGTSFTLKAAGSHIELWFDASYYKNHLGYFLWDSSKKLWTKPVAGWCSWMAYLQDVSEKNMLDAADFFSKNLKAYGYDIIQMDDGYQRVAQMKPEGFETTEKISDLWTNANTKFPSGLQKLASDIKAKGMTPGIWLGLYLPLGMKNADGYVAGPDGKPYRGPWVNYAVNGFIPKAVDEAYLQSLKGFKQQGWEYFKIDTLRHVIYDSYRKVPDYWKARNEDANEAFRAVFEAVKKTIGSNTYTLACWGTLPELAGIPDGCRIGEDVGPDFPSMQRSGKYMAQFNYLNNVLWRNDPDYMCFRVPVEQCKTWATLCALAGGHIMVSDPVESYDEARVDILRKVGPPIYLRPQTVGQLAPDRELWMLNATKFGESWTILTKVAWKSSLGTQISLKPLGLAEGKYLAFDFWKSEFLGIAEGSVRFQSLAQGNCQAIALRPLQDHPQILGTDRHIGQGIHELDNVKWSNGVLSGSMQCGPGRRYSLFLHVPDSYKLAELPTGVVVSQEENVIKLTFPETPGRVDWSLKFSKK